MDGRRRASTATQCCAGAMASGRSTFLMSRSWQEPHMNSTGIEPNEQPLDSVNHPNPAAVASKGQLRRVGRLGRMVAISAAGAATLAELLVGALPTRADPYGWLTRDEIKFIDDMRDIGVVPKPGAYDDSLVVGGRMICQELENGMSFDQAVDGLVYGSSLSPNGVHRLQAAAIVSTAILDLCPDLTWKAEVNSSRGTRLAPESPEVLLFEAGR